MTRCNRTWDARRTSAVTRSAIRRSASVSLSSSTSSMRTIAHPPHGAEQRGCTLVAGTCFILPLLQRVLNDQHVPHREGCEEPICRSHVERTNEADSALAVDRHIVRMRQVGRGRQAVPDGMGMCVLLRPDISAPPFVRLADLASPRPLGPLIGLDAVLLPIGAAFQCRCGLRANLYAASRRGVAYGNRRRCSGPAKDPPETAPTSVQIPHRRVCPPPTTGTAPRQHR